MSAKRLQILKEIAPAIKEVAVLGASGDSNVAFATASLEKAAAELGLKLTPTDVKSADDLPAAFDEMQRNHIEGLIVIAGAFTAVNSAQIASLALAHKLPSCHGFKETVVVGGLVSFGPDLPAMARQGAVYIDKIVRGASPADLPVEQPDRYAVCINLKTAKALGLEVPSRLLATADEAIE